MKTKTWKEIIADDPDTPEFRAAVEQSRHEAVAEIVAYTLAELRKARHVTQAELAHELHITQPALSGLEHRDDMQLSTLRDYIEGLGGHLEISAVFDEVTIPVDTVLQKAG
jgi:DNA-binding XRE family transcriptional regulator